MSHIFYIISQKLFYFIIKTGKAVVAILRHIYILNVFNSIFSHKYIIYDNSYFLTLFYILTNLNTQIFDLSLNTIKKTQNQNAFDDQ